MGLSVKEYVESLGYSTVAELNTAVGSVQAQIDAITEISDNGAESLAEKIQAINAVVSNADGELQQILTLIQANKQLVLDETTRATDVEAGLQVQLTAVSNKVTSNETALTGLSQKVTDNKTAQDEVNSNVATRLLAAEGTLETLAGDDTVDGSIAKAVKDEAVRTNTAISAVQEQINEITGGATGSISDIANRVGEVENLLKDTTDADGNLVKGHTTRITELENNVTNEATARVKAVSDALIESKAYTDANTLKLSSMDTSRIYNKFRTSLGLAAKDAGSTESGDGAVL